MRAVFPLIYAAVAIAPFAIVADVAFPIAGICKFRTDIAEHSSLQPFRRVIIHHA